MGTVVTIKVARAEAGAEPALARAFTWFHEIEEICTRFDPRSELMQLSAKTGEAVAVSPVLWEAVRFALAVAAETEGAFDPTVGHLMEERGYDREYRSGRAVRSPMRSREDVSYRDVELDEAARTILLQKPLTLDLGAVAKGLAIDAAAKELESLRDFSIDAGGDLFLSGRNAQGEPWRTGIRHPRRDGELIATLRVTDKAVCTSGDYERGQHILDGRKSDAAAGMASATVVAPGAMLADALATAAFALGPEEGMALLNRMGMDGLLINDALECFETAGWRELRQ
jgi:FAD:protein FMN transferase